MILPNTGHRPIAIHYTAEIPLSRIDERLRACRSRATGLVLLDLLQLDCGVVGPSVAHLDALTDSVLPTVTTASAAADVSTQHSHRCYFTVFLCLGEQASPRRLYSTFSTQTRHLFWGRRKGKYKRLFFGGGGLAKKKLEKQLLISLCIS